VAENTYPTFCHPDHAPNAARTRMTNDCAGCPDPWLHDHDQFTDPLFQVPYTAAGAFGGTGDEQYPVVAADDPPFPTATT
jgi:hypothetical protein